MSPNAALRGIILAGGSGHAAVSSDAVRLQATLAGIRQAHDLLPAQRAYAGGHSRDTRHLDARSTRPASSSCWAMERAGACTSAMLCRRHRKV